jgi:amidophosphoribosyltransferase
MSDAIKHECGITFIRLRKPISFYHEKYGTALYGLNKLYLLMEKQHNRGQDGAGIASVKLDVQDGYPYVSRKRSIKKQSISDIFGAVNQEMEELQTQFPDILDRPDMLKGHLKALGEVMIGHLRYGTQGRNNINYCHPFLKSDVEKEKNLVLAGNFNLVNTKELNEYLSEETKRNASLDSDLAAMMETIHHKLREDIEANGKANWKEVLSKANALFDGGYAVAGMVGDGASFCFRDAHAIRPMFYYISPEIIVTASERPAIMTAFNVQLEEVKELPAGHALLIDKEGNYTVERILPEAPRLSCSFERIYFSRGSDADIYEERKNLGRQLSQKVLEMIDFDLKNTIFSYIPNTAETSFFGLIKGAEAYLNSIKVDRIKAWDEVTDEKLQEMIHRRVRVEKIAIKDVKMRTFITQDSARDEMVQHVYDITYGKVRRGIDTLVVIDDSIVRGTTLRKSIIRMLDRLGPKRIIVVSSAPQIRYPDCYGIDMSKMGEFIAFQAAIELLKDRELDNVPNEVYAKCLQAEKSNKLESENFVKEIYSHFDADQISAKIAKMLKEDDVNAKVNVVYQRIEGLHKACPNNKGDWYFTGDYPTKGGNVVVNKAFMNYMENKTGRAY